MRRLVIFLLALAAIFAALTLRESAPVTSVSVPLAELDPDGDGMADVPKLRPVDRWDVGIAAVITVSSALAVLALMVGSHRKRDWSWQGLGMLGDYLGGTLIYFSVLAVPLGLWGRFETPEWYGDTLRAFFLAGCPILAFSLVRWMVSSPPSIEEQVEAGRVAGYAAGAESERTDVAERIEVGRSDGHAAGRAAERLDGGDGRR